MGGLAAAVAFAKKGFKHIEVFENAPGLGFVGAGIQIAPNLIRVLNRLGCWSGSSIEKDGTLVTDAAVIDGVTNSELALSDMSNIRALYGFPHYTGHRASLAGTLYEAAQKEPAISFHFGETVQEIISFGPGKVQFVVKHCEGEPRRLETDILIGADGIKSSVRNSLLQVLDLEGKVEDTGQACYRILLSRMDMEPYPELLKLLDGNSVKRWIGERRHIIAYPIDGHRIYNIATCQPDVNFAGPTDATWTTKGSKTDMMSIYADFCPVVQQLLQLAPDGDIVEWRLRSHTPLAEWTHGAVALLGDACHPTLPHLSQGAAMAIEDAATLAEVVARLPGSGADGRAIAKALKVYHLLRKERTATLVEMAAFSGRTLHLGEGQAKEERDRQFQEARKKGQNPDKWASPDVQKTIYEHDCVKDAQDRFDYLYASLQEQPQSSAWAVASPRSQDEKLGNHDGLPSRL
jgi:salicylate hydroxylase